MSKLAAVLLCLCAVILRLILLFLFFKTRSFLVIVKPFHVIVEDQDVYGVGGTATFTCKYPPQVSSYVQVRKWFADKQPLEAEPSGNLVIRDVQEIHSYKLYYCVVVNILSKETLASNVAKIFIKSASGNSHDHLF